MSTRLRGCGAQTLKITHEFTNLQIYNVNASWSSSKSMFAFGRHKNEYDGRLGLRLAKTIRRSNRNVNVWNEIWNCRSFQLLSISNLLHSNSFLSACKNNSVSYLCAFVCLSLSICPTMYMCFANTHTHIQSHRLFAWRYCRRGCHISG